MRDECAKEKVHASHTFTHVIFALAIREARMHFVLCALSIRLTTFLGKSAFGTASFEQLKILQTGASTPMHVSVSPHLAMYPLCFHYSSPRFSTFRPSFLKRGHTPMNASSER